MKGKLVILSGPSGVGKDAVLQAWQKLNAKVQKVVAYTTRPKRVGEVDGLDYHFVTHQTFLELLSQGAFLEHKEVYGNFYATPLYDMEQLLEKGRIAVLKIDVQGALEAMVLRPDALTIFLLPPSMKELESRIRSRATDTEKEIEKRLSKTFWEMSQASKYQYQIINDTVDQAVSRLEAILSSSLPG